MIKISEKTMIYTIFVATLLFVSFSVSAAYAKGGAPFAQDAKDAIAANDYAAFTTAIAGTRLEGRVDEEKFAKIVEKTAKKDAVSAAIINNDYEAFTNAVVGTKYEGKVDEERFAKLVEKRSKKDGIRAAVENNDYAAFQSSAEGTHYAAKITDEATFAKFVEAKNLAKAGDKEAARAILKEIQIKPKNKKGKKQKKGSSAISREVQAAIKEAFENNDYAAFTAAVAGTQLEGRYSEEDFQKKAEGIKSGDRVSPRKKAYKKRGAKESKY